MTEPSPRLLPFLRSLQTFAAAVALLSAVACSGSPSEIEYVDLIARQRLEIDGERLKGSERFAADETWVAVRIEADRRVTADVELHSIPVVDLSGIVVCGDVPTAASELVLTVGAADGEDELVIVDQALQGPNVWWSHSVDLAAAGGREIELALEARLPEGCSLLLRDVTVRQSVRRPEGSSASPPQILLISVDTLRRDAIGAFGGSVATPHLDRLAAESEIWTRHHAAATWTKPSHASMLTGYHPETHRAIHLNQAMDPAIPTLAGRFQTADIATAALVYDCGWLSRKWGFGKGFDDYRLTQWRAGRQAIAAAEWVRRHRDEPFFYFVHTFEPHSDARVLPYEAPGISRLSIAEQFGVENFGLRQGLSGSRFLDALDRGKIPRQPGDAEILQTTYQAGVRYLDESLGLLFDTLRESGIWDQLLVVVTSDHGEEFDEHGGFEHGSLYEEIIAVPLLIKWPSSERAGVTNDVLGSSIDLAPTLLQHANLPTDNLSGADLRTRTDDIPVFAGTIQRAVIDGSLKASFDHTGALTIFDLATDPGERHNLLEQNPRAVERLEELLREQQRKARELRRRIGSTTESREVELSEDERKRLKAFGYID
jgi:arylsulfatase A-like enzyme